MTSDRGWQDALAFASLGDIVTEAAQFVWQASSPVPGVPGID